MKEITQLSEDSQARNEQAEQTLFADSDRPRTRRYLAGIGAGIVATAAAYATYKSGLDVGSMLDTQIVPEPTVYPEIVDGFVVANESLRAAAPAVLAGGLTVRGYQKFRAGWSSKSRTVEELSRQEYSGVDTVAGELLESQATFLGRIRQRSRKFGVGMGVASLAVLLSGGFSGLEHEIAEGPLRPVNQFVDALTDGEEGSFFITQSPATTFMDDSYIKPSEMNSFVNNAYREGINVIPFNKSLPNIDGRSGLVISLPDRVFEEAIGEDINTSCADVPIMLDEANTTPVGQEVDINGVRARVTEKLSDTAQMNRDIAVMAESDFKLCLQQDNNNPYFGAVVTGESDSLKIQKTMVDSGLEEVSLITEDHFKDNNRKFWRANGTPLLLQMITYMGVFSAFAIGSERRGALQRNIREIGMLNAAGVAMRDIRNIEMRRALRETGKAALIAAPLMPVMAGVFNMATVGLKAGVGMREIAVGYTITLAAKLAGGIRAVRRFSKKMSLSDAVKG